VKKKLRWLEGNLYDEDFKLGFCNVGCLAKSLLRITPVL
jgi:hypothetical protein